MRRRRVHLVRHGLPLADHGTPAAQWRLDPAGIAAIATLRASGRLPTDALWFCSPEPKARETAALLTDQPVEVVDGLREQVRLQVGWIEDFAAVRAAAIAHPERAAYDGWEPLEATRARATRAVRTLLAEHPGHTLVLVGHGTCLALIAAELSGGPVDPQFPEALGFPDLVTVRMPAPPRERALPVRYAAIAAAGVTAAELVAWRETRQLGWVLGIAAVLAVVLALPARTRELGISLIGVVLAGGFLVALLALLFPQLGT